MRPIQWIKTLFANRRWWGVQKKDHYQRDLIPDLCVTQLETRRVLNGEGAVSELVIDAGAAADDGQADTYQIQANQDRVEVSVNGEVVGTAQLDQLQSITINGSSDDDIVIADLGNGLLSNLNLSVNAGDGGADVLRVLSDDQIDRVTHDFGETGEGRLQVSSNRTSATILYSGIEGIRQELSTDTLVVRFGVGGDVISLRDAMRSGESQLEFQRDANSPSASDSTFLLTFTNPQDELRIETATDDSSSDRDAVNVVGLDSSFDADLILQGDRSDTLDFTGQTAVGRGNLFAEAGDINIQATITTNGASVDMTATGGLTLTSGGTIQNDGGSIALRALQIDANGTLLAAGGDVELDSGDEGVTIVGGVIDVAQWDDGQVGGQVRVLGMNVGLVGNARIDASGVSGGGTVLIGGAYRGQNTEIRNTNRTFVGSDTSISADALRDGQGGTVVLWADDWTKFYGMISARGGSQSGDGGLIETSGKVVLEVIGASADASAANGRAGMWLLDPSDVTITGATTADVVQSGVNPVLFSPTLDDATIDAATINATLDGGTDVIVETVSARNQNGDITVTSAIAKTAGGNATLTLRAENDVIVNNTISSNTGLLDVILIADSDNSGAGDVDINATITTNGGTFDSTGVGFDNTTGAITTAGGGVSITHDGMGTIMIGATISSGAGNVTVAATGGGNITLANSGIDTDANADINSSGGTILSGNVDDNTANITAATLTVTGALAFGSSGGNGALDIDADTASITGIGGDIVVDAVGNVGLAITATTNAAGAITVTTSSEDLTLTDLTASDGAVSVTAAGRNIIATSVTSDTDNDANDITLDGSNITLGSVATTGLGDVTLVAAGAITNAAINGGAEVTADVLTVTGATSFGELGGNGGVDIDATTASITNIGGDLVFDAVGSDGLAITATTNAAGGITVTTSSEDLTLTNLTANDGAVSVTATGGNIIATSVTSSTDNDANDITLTTIASGNITLGSVATTGAGDVTLVAAAAITNAAINGGAEVTTDVLTVTGATSFGETLGNGGVDINATTASVTNIGGDIVLDAVGTGGLALTATTNAAGGITVTTSSEDLTLTDLTASDGAVSVTATGRNIIATSVTSATDDDANDITLDGTNITLGSVATTGLGDVTLVASGAITNAAINGGAEVTADVLTVNGATSFGETLGNGGVDIDATTASITNIGGDIVFDAVGSDGLAITATTNAAGGITVTTSSEDLTLTNLTTSDGAVSVTATGGNIIATSVTSSTDNDANDITLTTIASGNITLGSVATTGQGDVTLVAAAAITNAAINGSAEVTTDVLTVTGATSFGETLGNGGVDINAATASVTNIGGDIVLDAVGTGGLALTATTNAAGGITVTTSSEDLTLTDLTASDGAVSVTATGRNIIATSVTSATDNDANDITIDGDNITLGSVATTGQGDVTLVAAAAITNAAINGGAEVTADVLTVNGATSFGETLGNGGVDIDATTASITNIGGDIVFDAVGSDGLAITATTNAAGGITVTTSSEDLTLTNLTTSDGAVSVTATGRNIIATSVTSSTDNDANDITLTTLASGDITLGSVTTTGLGDVTLAAAGTITNGATNGGAEVTTDVLTVTGASSFGELGGNGSVDVDATTASITGIGGNIAVDAVGSGGLALAATTNAAGGITVTTSSEDLTLNNLTTNNGSVAVTATDRDIIATSVTSSTSNNANDVTLTTINSGNITLGSLTTTGLGDVVATSAGTLEAINAADNVADINAGDDVSLSGTTIGATNQIEILGLAGTGSTLALATTDGNIDVEELTNPHFGTIDLTIVDGGASTNVAVSLVGADDISIADDGTTLTIAGSGILTSAQNRDVSLTTSGLDVNIANGGVNLGSGNFSLAVPGGTILSGNVDDNTANITAATLTVTGALAFGSSGGNGALDIDSDTASITGIGGDIALDAVGNGGLAITATTNAAGAITVTTSSKNLTLSNLTASNGAVAVTATGRNIIATGVTSNAGNDLTLTTLTSGNITLGSLTTTGLGDVVVASAGTLEAINAADDVADINAGDDVTLSGTTTGATNQIEILGSAGGSTLTLGTADGNINVEELTNPHFGTIDLTIADGGAATNVAVGLSGADDISISDDGTVLTIAAAGVVTSGQGRDVSLTTSGLNVVIANGGVDLGTGDFTLTAPGATTFSGSPADNTANIIAGTLTVTGVTSFGETGLNGALDIDATTATITGVGGDIALDAVGSDGLVLTATTNAAGGITVTTSSEDLTLTDLTASDGAVSVTATGRNIIATSVTSATNNDANDITLDGDNITLGSVATTGLGDVTLVASGAITNAAINGGAEVTADVLTVTGATSFGETLGNGGVDIDATTATITNIGGDLVFDAVGIGGLAITATTNAAGEITVTTSSENLTLTNLTANDGAVSVTATGGNIIATSVTSSTDNDANDITLDTITSGDITLGDLTTTGQGDIVVNAAGQLFASLGGFTLTTGVGSVSEVIFSPNLLSGIQTGAPLTDSQRIGEVTVQVQDPAGAGFVIEIDWLEGDQTPPIPTVPPANLTARTVQGVVDGTPADLTISHQYEDAPDPANPAADINVIYRVVGFAEGTIVLNESGNPLQDRGQFQTTVTIDVAAPLFPFFPQLPTVQAFGPLPQPVPTIFSIPSPQRQFTLNAPQQLINSIGTTVQTSERYYVLRIVTFGEQGEIKLIQEDGRQEYRLKDMEDSGAEDGFELSQLPELFKRLPDDRYRIYLIDGQTERLVLDFIIRQGQPTEAQEETGPQGDKSFENQNDHLHPVPRDLQLVPPEDVNEIGDVVSRLGTVPSVTSGGILFAAGMVNSWSNGQRASSLGSAVEKLGNRPRRRRPNGDSSLPRAS